LSRNHLLAHFSRVNAFESSLRIDLEFFRWLVAGRSNAAPFPVATLLAFASKPIMNTL